jgi:hypothetical protein
MINQYVDFEMEIEPASAGKYLVRVESSAGRDRATLTLPTDQPAYSEFITNLAYNLPTTPPQVREFGKLLYHALIQGSIREAFRAARDEAQRNNQILRIKLSIDPSLEELVEVAAVPWEFAVNDTGVPISTEYSFCRFLSRSEPLPRLRIEDATIKVLLTSALPKELAEKFPVDVAAEVAAIRAALKPLEEQGTLAVVELPHLTGRKLQKAIENEQPHVIHYVGHGVFEEGIGSLVLEKTDGTRQDMPVDVLVDNLRGSTVRLVVLNACLTGKVELNLLRGIAPALLAANIPAVVAMQSSVGDEAGVIFAEDFYQNLAEYKPIDTCVSRGRRAIRNSTATRDWGLATLYMRAPDGILFEQPAAKDAASDAAASAPIPEQNNAATPGGVNVDMGSGNNFSSGTFSFGAIAGRDLAQSTTVNNYNAPGSPGSTVQSNADPDRLASLRRQSNTLKDDLNMLEEQYAKFGSMYAPTPLINQLKDKREELSKVNAEIAQLGG